MIAGFDGRLIAEQFLEQRVDDVVKASALGSFLARLRKWRIDSGWLGPATGDRTLFEEGATPLLSALGFSSIDDRCALEGGRATALAHTSAGAASVLVARYGEPLGPLTRTALSDAAERQVSWCLLFNGTHLRLLDATRPASRRHVELDLDAACDEEQSGVALWTVASAPALLGTHEFAVAQLIEQSDRHAVHVCRALRDGVVASSAGLLTALVGRSAHATMDAAYAQSLTLVYRILFLFFAEARGLLPTWHPVYRASYSLDQLCAEAIGRPASTGVWDTLRAISRLAHTGCRAGDLTVTAYNGRLFAPSRAPLIELANLPESAARNTLISLSTRPAIDREGRQPIAYRDLGVEQLGAVYETLLEYEPVNAPTAARERGSASAIRLEKGASTRKRTGSFYTPVPMTRYLIRRALGPLVREATPERILQLRVLDPSMGSGAFLVSACRYLADAYADALVASGGCHATDLGPPERALIRRTVAERCLYGVDLNPMAVQLAQLSLWLATLAADRPLGFLDHHLVTGNSLIGVWLSCLRQRPTRRPRDRGDLPLLDGEPIEPMLKAALPVRFTLTAGPSDTVSQIRDKERALQALNEHDRPLARWKAVADLWAARWLDPQLHQVATLFPALSDTMLSGTGALPSHVAAPVLARSAEVAASHHAFHWELEFPEVFFDASGERRADAGFDAVIGNPPWDMLRNEGGRHDATHTVRFARDAGVYQCCGDGHANCYQLFLERSMALLAPSGRLGLVLPSGLAADHGSTALRRWLFSSCDVDALVGFDNRRAIFDIHRSVRFILLSASAGSSTTQIRCRLGEVDVEQLERACDDHGVLNEAWWPLTLSPSQLARMTGPALAIPDCRSARDVSLLDRTVSRFAPLGAAEGWHASFGRELNATEDRDAFASGLRRAVPVIEGKQLEPFRVRRSEARYSISAADAEARLSGRYRRARLAYRDVASATNRQTLISAILPAGCVSTHTVLCLRTPLPGVAQWFLCGLFNSFVLNYFVRLRVTTHVTTGIVERLPVPTESEAAAAFRPIAAMARSLARHERPDVWTTLQARVARLYELTHDEFAHVLATFPLVDPQERQRVLEAFQAW